LTKYQPVHKLRDEMGRPRNSTLETSGPTAKRLVDAAIELFSSKGFKGTSIRDIAKETGLTTSAIYHNFGTKGGLLAAIEEQTIEPMMKELRSVYAVELPPADRLALLVRTHLTYIATHKKESRIFFLSEETLPVSKRDLNKKRQREIFFMYRAEIDRVLAAAGKQANPIIATFAILGSMMWLLTWYRPDGRFALEEVVDGIVEQVLHGCLGNASTR
jgi:TetR/AcrR family transcriptional regulator, cholesterol catabolism regulator